MSSSFRQTDGDDEASYPAPMGLLTGTLVRTLDGVLPVEFLEAGDRVITRSGARKIVAITAVPQQNLWAIRFTASTQGHERPEKDLLTAVGQPVVVRGWRAQTLYGMPVAVVPAERLVDGEFVYPEILREAVVFTLRFAEDEVIWAEGLEIACLAVQTEPAAS